MLYYTYVYIYILYVYMYIPCQGNNYILMPCRIAVGPCRVAIVTFGSVGRSVGDWGDYIPNIPSLWKDPSHQASINEPHFSSYALCQV